MPWTVKRDPEGCSEQMPWAVVKLNDGEIVGCHATQDDAQAQVAALYAGEEDDPEEYTDAMLAALPTDPHLLAVESGLPAGELHVTLRYLGEAENYSLLDRRVVCSNVEVEASQLSPFDALVSGVGYLGSDRATVLLLEHENFNVLREAVERCLAGIDVPTETYPHYIPHLTLGYGLPVDRAADLLGSRVRVSALRVAFEKNNSDYALASDAAAVLRGAAPTHHTDTVEGAWDAGMHVGRLSSPMSTAVANRMFAWYDSGEVTDGKIEKQYCKLPHHAVGEDGSPGAAVLNGVRNALARLNQTEMPDADRESARAHLRAHLDDAPESDSDRNEEEMAEIAIGEVLTEDGGEEISGEEISEEISGEEAESEEEISEDDGEEGELEVEATAGNRDWAESRLSSVPVAAKPVTGSVRADYRQLPPELLERLESQQLDVGVVDRVGRGLFELRFRPEFRFNDDGSVFLHGYATVYGHPYEVMGGPPYGWVETIMHRACDVSVNQGADVRLLVNHDGIALARTRSGTLRLESDDVGLYSCAPSLDMRSPTVQSLVSAMQRGDMDEMSFAFRAIQQDWNEDYTERQITEVKLYDVSVVTYPANPATVTALRDEPDPTPGYPTGLARAQVDRLRIRRDR